MLLVMVDLKVPLFHFGFFFSGKLFLILTSLPPAYYASRLLFPDDLVELTVTLHMLFTGSISTVSAYGHVFTCLTISYSSWFFLISVVTMPAVFWCKVLGVWNHWRGFFRINLRHGIKTNTGQVEATVRGEPVSPAITIAGFSCISCS
ncbi:hypothetical protein BDV33DRAFT_126752 [Aspergillus novoparasiticus]|uniref:Uncharacterized protein n=1 Tax=Aspergillus novoparasiticus TaxID=986946 RepID=A0A5N6ELD1_9EURO|nr:hypothetical protein BDV33DRAFT_126752 [Aspergillus novoparasiticus]